MLAYKHDDVLAHGILLADDLKARVERRALERAQDVSEYVNARLREILGLDDETREKVRRGREDLAAGRIVDDSKVDAWLESWGKDDELDPPE
jgi:predicted transcriptional regulator